MATKFYRSYDKAFVNILLYRFRCQLLKKHCSYHKMNNLFVVMLFVHYSEYS